MRNQTNVILLIFDTLRSDYLGCYGSDLDTPAIDFVADEGTLFEAAFSTAPGTPISHASLYSGRYPSNHGVTGQYIELPEDIPVMAEWFREAGYDTFGITGPAKMGSDWGYDRGFDELFEHYYDLPSPPSVESISKSITNPRFRRYMFRQLTKGGAEKTRYKFDLIEDKIRTELERPFYLLCNFTTTHSPYDPPRPYKELATPGFSRPGLYLLEYLFDNPGTIADPDVRLERVMNLQSADGVGRFLADPDYLNEKEIQVLRDWYAATVEYLDDEFDRFLRFYRRELSDDTILILTADHGEQLGEHGLWEHSYYLYDETLKIPLIAVGPDIPAGDRRKDLVSHVDLFDSLCERCGLSHPDTTDGISIFGNEARTAVFMEYGKRDVSTFATESNHGRYLSTEQLEQFAAGRKAIRTEQYRFEFASTGEECLFEFPGQIEVSNPSEQTIAPLRETLLETLGDEFGVWPEEDPTDGDINQEVERNLRQLGYIE